MGKIKKILENELTGGNQSTEVYPVTSIKAVYDENNERLDNIIDRKDNEIQKELEAEVARATNAESNLRETINNITEINENTTSANIVTVDTIPNTSSSNVQQALNELFKNATFAGIATPATNPGTPNGPVFYFATEAGTYSNFSNITINTDETAILVWNSGATWEKEVSGFASSRYLMDEIARATAAEQANTTAIQANATAISELIKHLYNSDYCFTVCVNKFFEATNKSAVRLSDLADKGITGKIKVVMVSDTDVYISSSYTTVESPVKYFNPNIDDTHRYEYSLDLGEETLNQFVIGNYVADKYLKDATVSAWIVQDKTDSMLGLYKRAKKEYNNKFKQYENKPYGTVLENKTLADGEKASLPENYIHQALMTSAYISFSKSNVNILFGRGFNSPRGEWVEITATNINEHHYWYNEGDTVIEHTHGLTLKSPIFIEIMQGSFVDTSNYRKRIITLTNGDGNTYKITTSGKAACGTPFVTNNSGFNITIAKMVFTASRYTEDLWIYGDSWCEGYWLPLMYSKGYYNFLTSCRSGQASSEALRSFKNDINIRIPKYVIWAEGMNNSSDLTETEPNDIWLADTIEFLEICNKNNITPILQTIPSCYGNDTWQKDHRAKNAWIRDFKNIRTYKYRIAEIDKLVSNGDGTWKEGLRDSETGVHTSSLGSAICAAYYIVKVPEITKIL